MPGGGASPTLNTGPTGALKSPLPLICTSDTDFAFTSHAPPACSGHGGLLQGGHAPPLPGAWRSPNCFAISMGTSMFEFELMSIRLAECRSPACGSALKPILSKRENSMVTNFASCHEPPMTERMRTTANVYLKIQINFDLFSIYLDKNKRIRKRKNIDWCHLSGSLGSLIFRLP